MEKITNLFKGRLNRVNFLIGFVLLLIVSTAGIRIEFLGIPLLIIGSILSISLVIRRWHDFNRPWYYSLSPVFFFIAIGFSSVTLSNICKLIYLIVLLTVAGSRGKNRFGDEDKTIGLKSILGLKNQILVNKNNE